MTNPLSPKPNSPARRILSFLPLILSIIGIGILLSRLDPAELAEALTHVDYRFFFLSLLLNLLAQFGPPWRWSVMLNYRISLWRSCTATFAGDFVNALTPLRMGEIVRASLIRRSQNIPLGEGLSSIVFSQVMDVLALAVLGIVVLLNAPLPEELVRGGVVMGVLGIISLLVLFLVVRWSDHLEKRLEPLFIRFAGEKRSVKLLNWLRHIISGLQALQSPLQLIYALAITLGLWVLLAISGWVMLLGMTDNPPLVLGFAVGFAGGIGRLIPALPGSIGTLDFAVMFSLTTLGVPNDTAIAFVLLLRLRYILTTIITGSIALSAEGMSLSGLRQFVSAPKP